MKAIFPNWQAPANIKAFTTIREGGVSQAPFDSFNLGDHVGDDKTAVKINRTLLREHFQLPQAPLFLNQTHSTKVISLPYEQNEQSAVEADGVYSNMAKQVCLVMTADCLPVLFCNKQGTEVAAAHAGWRGLCNGILEQTLACFQSPKTEIQAWLGPAISQQAFQVGEDVRQQFMQQDPQAAVAFSVDPQAENKYFADLYQLARLRLKAQGIEQIFGGEYCTYQQNEQFFSYRRDQQTGRMATLIWFED